MKKHIAKGATASEMRRILGISKASQKRVERIMGKTDALPKKKRKSQRA